MSISVIVPSCGRPTLEYTVASVLRELNPTEGDELIVVSPRKPRIVAPCYDIRDDFKWLEFQNGGYDEATYKSFNKEPGYPSGAVERDAGKAIATGTHIMVIDDDDIFIEGAIKAARFAATVVPDVPHIFRMRYGTLKQWISPEAKNLKATWNRGLGPEYDWVLWGDPVLKLGNVGSAMCLLPNDPSIKWDCSAPGGQKNVSEDFWVVRNFVQKNQCRPIFHETVIGIIKPTIVQLRDAIGIEDQGLRYVPQPVVGWNGVP
jgi:hypothetical protein